MTARRSPVWATGPWLLLIPILAALSGCSRHETAVTPVAPAAVASAPAPLVPAAVVSEAAASTAFKPTATFQEIMDSEVAPAADFIWASVSSTVTKKGVEEHQPRTDKEWRELRRRAVVLAEVPNLLAIPGRRTATGKHTLEDNSPLDTAAIQKRLEANPAALRGYAEALRSVSVQLRDAIDHRDIAAISSLGGTLDEVCEACHLSFWYPPDTPGQSAATTVKQEK